MAKKNYKKTTDKEQKPISNKNTIKKKSLRRRNKNRISNSVSIVDDLELNNNKFDSQQSSYERKLNSKKHRYFVFAGILILFYLLISQLSSYTLNDFILAFIIISYVFFVIWLIAHPEDRSHKFTKLYSTGNYDYYYEEDYGPIIKQFFFALLIVLPIISFFVFFGTWVERKYYGRQFSDSFIKYLSIYNSIWLVIILRILFLEKIL